MSKKFIRYKKQRVPISLVAFTFKQRKQDEDDSVPFMYKKDLYRDKVQSPSTH